jgi:hypothetical protein
MRRVQIIGALCLAVATCLIGAVGASAAPTDPFQYKYSFGEGINTTFGSIFVNHQTGNVLVKGGDGYIHQFDADGNPVDFSATGSPELSASGRIAIADGGGPTQGNIYVFDGTLVHSYRADGSLIGEFQPQTKGIFKEPLEVPLSLQAMFVDPDGTLWLVGFEFIFGTIEYVAVTPELVPIGPRSFVEQPPRVSSSFSPVEDKLGNLYWDSDPNGGPAFKIDANNGFTTIGSANLGVGGEPRQEAIDPSTNDVYRASENFGGGLGWVSAQKPDATSASPAIPVLTADKGLDGAGGVGLDATGQRMYVSAKGRIRVFHREQPSAPHEVEAPAVTHVRGLGAVLESTLSDGGAVPSYYFEYGTTTSYGNATNSVTGPRRYFSQTLQTPVEGLQPNTTYHFRIVVTNSVGTTYGPDGTFKTYPLASGIDLCPNALARKQTVAQRLPDCRAYELASAADTGGYDVESYLAPGQTPFPGFPLATDKLLYATHSGAVPGPWNATNKGPDPYLATRTANGWVTDYEGLPSDLNPAAGSFSSVLGEADSSLSTLAFAGPSLCSPCFTSGTPQTGIPVRLRLPSGQLVQGMSGSLAGSVPATAKPEGKVAKYFSGDGKKLLFASKYAFEPGANDNNGSLTVYERDLGAGTTEIASTDPAGNALSGEGISALDVSSDGSRVVIGKKLGVDPFGNEYVHPYLHLAGRPESIDLAPLASAGVLYAGMSSDGSKVFFTSPDKLIGSDTDTSADLYEADVDGQGSLSLKAITANNSDACAPIDCSALAIGGGGGVASASGAIYFLSPESLGGQGTPNLPNLYLARPSGQISLVATLELDNPLLLDSITANATRKSADFQTTPSGNYAAFMSKLVLANLNTSGFLSAYRYNAGSGQLACASCDLTNSVENGSFDAAELPPNGLALLEDGRLFFTTTAQLVLNDANGKKDVYEWLNGEPELASSGTGPFDSALLTVSGDGTDVFFFTHDNLAPEEDHNGGLMRIYDAREGGGFFKLPPRVACQASDECHGAGTPAPGPADIKSSGKTTPGNVIACAKNRVKKRGQCVKKKQAHAKKKHKKHAKKRKSGAKARAAGTNGKRGGRNA